MTSSVWCGQRHEHAGHEWINGAQRAICPGVASSSPVAGSPLQDAGKLRDVRVLLESIVAHDGHAAVEHCVPEMVATARAALTVIDSDRWDESRTP